MLVNMYSTQNAKVERVIDVVSKRFSTYGYTRIKTAAFEKYDLFSTVTSSVNRKEMVKVIDTTGDVLVLRPDVTIPITQELSHVCNHLTSEYRFYYIQEVFRQSFEKSEKTERTQAGIEYFCESSPEADAETIALAIQMMKDLNFKEMKIEIGHTAFFNEIVNGLHLQEEQLERLKTLVVSKNIGELNLFIQQLLIDPKRKLAIEQLPFLYGKPEEVLERAKEIVPLPNVIKTVCYIEEIYRILKLYGLDEYVVIDFGLMNHMDYYSGVLFQGYVERLGKPVLMGGRYDELGKKFEAELPAIGFACEIESLVKALQNSAVDNANQIDLKIIYDESELGSAIQLAAKLRALDLRVIIASKTKESMNSIDARCIIRMYEQEHIVEFQGNEQPFTSIEQLDWLGGNDK